MSRTVSDWPMMGIVAVAAMIVALILLKQVKRQKEEDQMSSQTQFEIEYLIEEIKGRMFELTTPNMNSLMMRSEVYKRELSKRIRLKKALKGCSSGSKEDKAYIIELIGDLLKNHYVKNDDEANQVIPFNRPNFLSSKDQFDVLLYKGILQHGSRALSELIEKENWHEAKIREDELLPVYRITSEDVEKVYTREAVFLSYSEKIQLIAQRIYEKYKGFGVIDSIRDMDIDGISGGVSGVTDIDREIIARQMKESHGIPRNYDSIWIFYKGKSLHLSFLTFGTDRELKRVCQAIYRYNKAPQLSEERGYLVNEMKDGSRVVVVRPPFAEGWAFFVRKFHLKNLELEDLFKDENSQLPIQLVKYLMKGGRITAVTGAQGSGKTTLLMSMVRWIYPTLTLRIQEMAFELNLRKLYPNRNILTFKETECISGQQGLDLQKKTDGSVNILGEIATDEVSVLMLQMAQVASLFTVFTHHGKTVDDLILSLRNSLLKCNIFRDEKIAVEQVVKVLEFDIHMKKDYNGKRYIERITEIVAGEDGAYEKKIIMSFQHGKYQLGEPISEKTANAMMEMMTPEDQNNFNYFLLESWGSSYAEANQYC